MTSVGRRLAAPVTVALGASVRDEGWFTGFDGHRVWHRWAVPDVSKGRVLLLHGYSEYSGRYAHVIDRLVDAGFAVVAHDHRGHGKTARLLGDIGSRHALVADVATAHLRLMGLGRGPCFVLGHSMGALIALRCLALWGDAYAGAVLNGTAVEVPDGIPAAVRFAAGSLARLWPTLPVQPFFDVGRLSRDPEVRQRLIDDPLLYKGRIRARTGVEMMAFIAETQATLADIRAPLLMTHGGDDLHVPVGDARRVLNAVSSADKRLDIFDGLLHETHQEPERDDVIDTWINWLTERV